MGGGCVKVTFLGMREAQKSGCSACGKRRTTSTVIKREKKMRLPSGQLTTFHAGHSYEVTEDDGAFLLAQTDGKGHNIFREEQGYGNR